MSGAPVLVADIGGTNARFALAQPGARPGAPSVWLTSIHGSLADALDAFLEQEGRPKLSGAAMCAAGPVERDGDVRRIRMTNCPWEVDTEGLRAATGVARPLLVNDFTALAMALPYLTADDHVQIGGSDAEPDAVKAVLGPGTGLGVSGLVPSGGEWIPLSGEGGHVTLAPGNEREISLVFQLMQTYGHVSAERVLCGPGLEALYGALGALDAAPDIGKPTAADIARMARDGSSALALEAIHTFTALLGSVAGNLALTLGARGGVYLAGGILPRWGDLFEHRLFRHRFEAKGRMRSYLSDIPVYLVETPDIALIGLAEMARAANA